VLWGPAAGTQAPTFAHVGLWLAGGRNGPAMTPGRIWAHSGRRRWQAAGRYQAVRSGANGDNSADRRPAGTSAPTFAHVAGRWAGGRTGGFPCGRPAAGLDRPSPREQVNTGPGTMQFAGAVLQKAHPLR